MFILETKDLTHQFVSGIPVINHLSIQVPTGSIYGFLGPNGAGKSTTLRLILGLIKQQQGKIAIFGKSLTKARREILSQVGSLIETPSLYEHLTASENLLLLQKVYQCPKGRITQVLELVGLTHTGNKKTKHFSLGMKQRLAIAIAMLHQPRLLILDEPTNGLDPNGMVEIRELLKQVNAEENTTILLSSHLLSEIEKLVTHVGVVSKGSLSYQGTLQQLMKKSRDNACLVIKTNDNLRAMHFLNSLDYKVQIREDTLLIPVGVRPPALVNQLLVAQGFEVSELRTTHQDLENIFMQLINEQ